MQIMTKLATCALLALPILGCQRHIEKQDHATDKAAETALKDQREFRKDLKDDVNKGVDDLSSDLKDVNKSTAAFEQKKAVRLAILRDIHALHVTEAAMMRGVPQTLAYTAAGEADINSKLADVSTQLDNTGKLIEALPNATAEDWSARDDEVSAAMTRLVVAIQDARTSLRDAPRQTPTTSS